MNGIEQPVKDRRPRPVLIAAGTVTVLEGLVGFVSWQLGLAPEAIGYLMSSVAGVGTILGAALAQRRVTPLRDPRDERGRPMVAYDERPSDPVD